MINKEVEKFISAVIVAAGKGKRMNSDINKQYIKVSGIPVLARTLMKFEECQRINEIILVINEDEIDYCKKNIIQKYNISKVNTFAKGGKERQESVYHGLLKVNKNCDIVLIHDGARPFVSNEILCDSIDSAITYGGSCTGVPVKDTIKEVHIDGIITKTLPRSCLWSVQTPQTFKYTNILKAHEKSIEDGYNATDDSSIMEFYGEKIKMVMGSYKNIKITTSEDLSIAEILLKD